MENQEITDSQSIQANGSHPGSNKPYVRIVFESSEDVTIDEEGRIFRYDGKQIVMRGLEPENILRSLEDVAAGRMTSLEDVRARRS